MQKGVLDVVLLSYLDSGVLQLQKHFSPQGRPLSHASRLQCHSLVPALATLLLPSWQGDASPSYLIMS